MEIYKSELALHGLFARQLGAGEGSHVPVAWKGRVRLPLSITAKMLERGSMQEFACAVHRCHVVGGRVEDSSCFRKRC